MSGYCTVRPASWMSIVGCRRGNREGVVAKTTKEEEDVRLQLSSLQLSHSFSPLPSGECPAPFLILYFEVEINICFAPCDKKKSHKSKCCRQMYIILVTFKGAVLDGPFMVKEIK